MSLTNHTDIVQQVEDHLSSSCVMWLFGAGISSGAGIPTMVPLTNRALAILNKNLDTDNERLVKLIQADLDAKTHIEHILNHIGDCVAVAQRARSRSFPLGGSLFSVDRLISAHSALVSAVSETIRWGYVPGRGDVPEQIGSNDAPITTVSGHVQFIKAVFETSHAGLQDRRRPVCLFTLNYDTLLEDALALCCIPYWDGFSGGAVAFRSHRFGQEEPQGNYRAHVIKLHGSIDWHLTENDNKIWRTRPVDTYPDAKSSVLIYPQATKYVATQKDPLHKHISRKLVANPLQMLKVVIHHFEPSKFDFIGRLRESILTGLARKVDESAQ